LEKVVVKVGVPAAEAHDVAVLPSIALEASYAVVNEVADAVPPSFAKAAFVSAGVVGPVAATKGDWKTTATSRTAQAMTRTRRHEDR